MALTAGTRFDFPRLLTAVVDAVPMGAGSVVMGTGIVSIAMDLAHQRALSDALGALAAACFAALGLVLAARVMRGRTRALAEARSPAGLTGVAATAVLGARAVERGWPAVAAALLVVAVLAWAPLTAMVLRRVEPRISGEWFMPTVAAEGLAALAASLAVAVGARWLADLALAPAAIGIAIYPVVLARFDPRGLRSGLGAHWVAGGSLAISALACAQIVVAERHLGNVPGGWGPLAGITFGLWVGAMLWLPVLVIAEVRWPRFRYDRHRWSTVFPLGMYSVCGFSVSAAAHRPWIADFARDWAWVALAAWTATMLGTLRRCLDATYSAAGSTSGEHVHPGAHPGR